MQKSAETKPERSISQTKCNYGGVYKEKDLLEQSRRLNHFTQWNEGYAKCFRQFFRIEESEHIICTSSIELISFYRIDMGDIRFTVS